MIAVTVPWAKAPVASALKQRIAVNFFIVLLLIVGLIVVFKLGWVFWVNYCDGRLWVHVIAPKVV